MNVFHALSGEAYATDKVCVHFLSLKSYFMSCPSLWRVTSQPLKMAFYIALSARFVLSKLSYVSLVYGLLIFVTSQAALAFVPILIVCSFIVDSSGIYYRFLNWCYNVFRLLDCT